MAAKKEKSGEETFFVPADGKITIIGRNDYLVGELKSDSSLHIFGKITGSIKGDSEVRLEEGSIVRADIQAESVGIYGMLSGKVVSSKKVNIGKTAHFEGDVRAPRLIVESGAFFKGRITMA